MPGILIAGTSSDAGKSLVVTGLCRALHNMGIDVAPFKAQNMSNNSMVCSDGTEIGRAQYLQAQAAKVEPGNLMNPVLLKPGSDRTSHIILRGKPAGQLHAGQYANERTQLAQAAWEAYRELESQHQLIVCEGAGSPAEINLRKGDYTNMGLAQAVNLPVVLVGDIDRGGVLASLYGTWAIVDESDRARLRGFIINKFRGDQSVLDPGLNEISHRTKMHNFGVLPWISGAWLDGEDTLEVGRWRHDGTDSDPNHLTVAVVRLPRVSNATDVDALASEPGVDVYVTQSAATCKDADLVVLPGSRSTLHDLQWLRQKGIADVIVRRHQQGKPVLGICGGYQMLGHHIADGLESGQHGVGLGLLPHNTVFHTDKTLARPQGTWQGVPVSGYEIHHGHPEALSDEGLPFLDGRQVGHTFGTMWHGALECDGFRQHFLTQVANASGCVWKPDVTAIGYTARREKMIDTLSQSVTDHLDISGLLKLTGINV